MRYREHFWVSQATSLDIVSNHDTQDPVLIEQVAAEKGRTLLESKGRNEETAGLRISVQNGGCEGLSYDLDLDNGPAEDDLVSENYGLRVFVDSQSLKYLRGSVLSYNVELQNTGFDVQNPNVESECGCGNSFTVQ